MKIKCPECGCENYFTGLEDEYVRFCSSCGAGLFELNNPNTDFFKHKIFLDKETFCNKVVVWLKMNLEVGEKEFFYIFSKEIEEFGTGNVIDSQFYLENIYFNMFLIYFSCASVFKNKDKVDNYFNYFIDKTYDLIFKKKFGKYKKEVWMINIIRRLKDYAAVCNSETEGKYNSAKFSILLGGVFCKNFNNKAELDSTYKMAAITSYLFALFRFSFESLEKFLKEYKI